MGFFQDNRAQLQRRGIDPDGLPPGQYSTDRFPVLHVGDVPRYADDLSDWDLRIWGLVDRPTTLSFDQLRSLPVVERTFDIHCVTKWSRFDTTWTGVRLADVLAVAGLRPEATHLVEHAEQGYTTNIPLEDASRDDVLVAWAVDGVPLEPDHGYPVRVVLPHRYFWKSAKWLRGLECVDGDRPGFWERNGYHNDADPFAEQRHWGD